MKNKKSNTAIFINKGRLTILTTVLCVIFCIILWRLYYLHVERSEESVEEVDKARSMFDSVPARRGDIIDSKNNILATSRSVITLVVDPERFDLRRKTKNDKDANGKKLPKEVIAKIEAREAQERLEQLTEYLKTDKSALLKMCLPYSDNARVEKIKSSLSNAQKRRLFSIGLKLNMTFDELVRKCATTPNSEKTVQEREAQVKKNPKLFKELSQILKIDTDELKKNFVSFSIRYKKLADNLDESTYRKIKELRIKGIRGERKYVRVYPSGELAAHVVGYVNKEFKAKLGIEKQFDYYLKGQDGWIETERDGNRKELVHFRKRDIEPTDGMNVELTIDSIIQEIARREVDAIVDKYAPNSATIIVSDPSTGYILAMASYPNFDPNNYGKCPEDSLRNRAICDRYEPGSTFKIVSISAALNESLVGPEDVFDCDAQTAQYKGKSVRLPKEAHKMGKLSVREITKKSSNKGSAQLGILLGEKKLYHYAKLFGYGEKTDVGLTGEVAGTLHPVKNWDGLTITRLPMGHAVDATPLQVHCAMSVIANQGIYMQPQLVRRVFSKNGETAISYPPKAIRRVISPKIATLMSEMLTEVVGKTGTAQKAAIKGFKVAGKTGTTQKIINGNYSSRDHIGSFTGFFPAQRPRLAITVVVDSPKMKGIGYGGVVAAPSFKNVAEQAANYLGIQTDEEFEKMVAWR